MHHVQYTAVSIAFLVQCLLQSWNVQVCPDSWPTKYGLPIAMLGKISLICPGTVGEGQAVWGLARQWVHADFTLSESPTLLKTLGLLVCLALTHGALHSGRMDKEVRLSVADLAHTCIKEELLPRPLNWHNPIMWHIISGQLPWCHDQPLFWHNQYISHYKALSFWVCNNLIDIKNYVCTLLSEVLVGRHQLMLQG